MSLRLELGLLPLQDRSSMLRISLLMRILSDEDRHDALASEYAETLDIKKHTTIICNIYAFTKLYHNSFLPYNA